MTINAGQRSIPITINSMKTISYSEAGGRLYTWCATKEVNVFADDIFVGTPARRALIKSLVDIDCR